MKKRITIFSMFILFCIGLTAYLTFAQTTVYPPSTARVSELITPTKPWVNFRTPAVETAAAAYDWTSDNMVFYELVANSAPANIETYIDATSGLIDVWDALGYGVNAVKIAFYSKQDGAAHDEEDTFDFELLAFADNSVYGPALPVYSTTGGACIVGTGLCAYHPIDGTAQTYGRWVDIISGTNHWPTGVMVADSGNNHVCTITFDMMGNRYLLLRTFNSGAGATEAKEIGAVITGY